MPHPAHPAQPQQFSWLAIPEICPPGEGAVLQTDKIVPSRQRRPQAPLTSVRRRRTVPGTCEGTETPSGSASV
jgi:hypothetical protein